MWEKVRYLPSTRMKYTFHWILATTSISSPPSKNIRKQSKRSSITKVFRVECRAGSEQWFKPNSKIVIDRIIELTNYRVPSGDEMTMRRVIITTSITIHGRPKENKTKLNNFFYRVEKKYSYLCWTTSMEAKYNRMNEQIGADFLKQ